VRRFQRIKMWRRTLLRSLFSWYILKRRVSVRMFWRLMVMGLCIWCIFRRRVVLEDFEMEE
jgi:hypothetical protein